MTYIHFKLPSELENGAERIVLFYRTYDDKSYIAITLPEMRAGVKGDILIYSSYKSAAPKKEIPNAKVDLFISLIQNNYKISLLKDRCGHILKRHILDKYIRLVKKYYIWQKIQDIENAKDYQLACGLRNFIVSYIYGDRVKVQEAMEFINNCISFDFK